MYHHDSFDRGFVRARCAQFRAQVARRIDGSLTEDEFKPLRLMNGLYLQLHAYMLRVAVPYGTIRADQLRALASITDRWDRGYGHVTTRQNMQFNWPLLTDVPDMLDALADVGLHAIQTSGNTIRNVTADHFAGVAADELADPRPAAELLRQWSTDHPEFQFLPRKFKLAVTGSPTDRAVIRAHDIGLRQHFDATGAPGFEVFIGGGLGRTPVTGKPLRGFLPLPDLLPYVQAIVAVYNLLGRRDNKYKARIKITVQEHGIETIRELVEDQFQKIRPEFKGADQKILAGIERQFTGPTYIKKSTEQYEIALENDPSLRSFIATNIAAHKAPDHAIVTISLKAIGHTPGDVSSDQMRLLADLADTYSHGELRFSHEQNIILPHVHHGDLAALYGALKPAGLASANIGLISDIIACPGMDYCALATARSIPLATAIATRFNQLKLEHDIGPLKIKISGCINACGHHHVGHIGILGLDRAGVENYQITLGGDGTETFVIGKRAGPGFAYDAIVPAIERLILAYLVQRSHPDETFLQCFRRLGDAPFIAALYPPKEQPDAA